MHPELFTLPIVGLSIKSYGFCLMVGFLSAVWLGMRRAQRVKLDPDVLLDLALLCLLFGVGGARLFYVVHYWPTKFASAANPLLAIIDITKGGLEFLGGFIGAVAAIVVYAIRKKISLRLYLDVLAPSTMWGLAFGRLGCFLNGCCFGAVCLAPAADGSADNAVQPDYAWAVEFPFGSPAHVRQWESRQVTVPAEMIATDVTFVQPLLVASSALAMSEKDRKGPGRTYRGAKESYEKAVADGADEEVTAALRAKMEVAKKRKDARHGELLAILMTQQYPSRVAPERKTSVTELQELAAGLTSVPVHPAQLYSAIHAMLLSLVLSSLFYIRKRHGVIAAALLILYPIPRILLEMIRTDNPQDVGGLTASQFVSLGLLVSGFVALYVLYTRFPLRSPVLGAPYVGNTATDGSSA